MFPYTRADLPEAILLGPGFPALCCYRPFDYQNGRAPGDFSPGRSIFNRGSKFPLPSPLTPGR